MIPRLFKERTQTEERVAKDIISEPSRTLAEYRLLPGLTQERTSADCDGISLRTPLAWAEEQTTAWSLNIPVVAAAMRSVSGYKMAVELAKCGGTAFIPCSQPVEEQVEEIRRIKDHKAGFVRPLAVRPGTTIMGVEQLKAETGYSTFPVTDDAGVFLGLLTQRDYDPVVHQDLRVDQRMVSRSELDVLVGTPNLATANARLVDGHQSVLPILSEDGILRHLVFRKDIQDQLHFPLQVVDERKRWIAAAAVNTHDYEERVAALVDAEVDVLCIDASDGHAEYQRQALAWCSSHAPQIPVIAGNVITAEGFRYLADAGAHGVKVGMGSGSICITQEQKGTGRGLATAIIDVCRERDLLFEQTGRYLSVIADGGVINAKDIVIALALGADYVMMGRYFARMDESPTEKVQIGGRVMKPYWGEGSAKARQWLEKRYQQARFVEGVEGFVEYAGKLVDSLSGTLAKIRASMASCGCCSIEELHRNARVELVSGLSIREGRVHDVYLPEREDRSSGWPYM